MLNQNQESAKENKDKNDFMYKLSSGENLPIENFKLKDIIKKDTLFSKPCQIHKTENLIYCFNCSKGICNYCRAEHMNHMITVKNNFLVKPNLEKFLLSKIESNVKSAFELSYPKKLYDFFYDKLDNHFKIMTENLEKYRVQRLKELNIIFENMEKSTKEFNSHHRKCKGLITKFMNESKNFFPSSYYSEIVFLQIFNLVNNGLINEKNVLNEVKKTKQKTVAYEEELSKALFDIELIFKDTLHQASSLESIVTQKPENPFEDFNRLLEETLGLVDKFSSFANSKKKRGRNQNFGVSSSSVLDFSSGNQTYNYGKFNKANQQVLSTSPEKNNNLANNNITTTDVIKLPSNKKIKIKEGNLEMSLLPNKSIYGINNYKQSNKSVEKEEIVLDKYTNLKIYESAFVSYVESGELKFQKLNLKETSQIEKIMEASEIKISTSQKKLPKNMNVFLNPQNKIINTYSASNQLLNLLKIYAELNYSKGKIEKYDDIDNINKNQNWAATNIANSPLVFLEEEGYEYFQAVSTTNKIQIFDFQNKKPYLIDIPGLNKKEHDYDIFPYGCRSFYKDDKIYIFGGKDVNREYTTILLFDTNTCKITKIGEMIHPRSFHSLNFSHERDLLYIIGGEGNDYCEYFKLSDYKCFPLPQMNYSRANCSLFNYKNEYLYAFCGFKKSIIEQDLNNTFERLNITEPIYKRKEDFNVNWEKVSIKNEANINLQFEYTGVMPLTDSHAFLYCGYDKRTVHRSLVVLDFINHKIISIEDKEFLELNSGILEDIKFNEIFDSLIKFK